MDPSTPTVPARRPTAEADPAEAGPIEAGPPPAPESRSRGAIEGTPTTLGDGREWLLADHVPGPGEVWDRLYDHNVLRGRYDGPDLCVAAFHLLRANYRLDPAEAFDLLYGVLLADLVVAVEAALFGVDRPYRGWSQWIETSLWSNGIDPVTVPPSKRRDVVEYLVAAGRAVPAAQFLSSHKAMAQRRKILDFAERRKARQTPADDQVNGRDAD